MGLDRLRNRFFPASLPLFDAANAELDSASPASAGKFGAGADRGSTDAAVADPVSVVILGPPGAGKGTQAKLLSELLGLPHVSTGEILRDRILVGDAFGREIADRIDFGQFVPDDWINRILDERVALADCRYGVILDGYPRTLAQAERFCQLAYGGRAKVVLVRLRAEPEMLALRFAGRRQCSACGTLFHLRYQPSLAGEVCDRPGCSGVLELRLDDRPEFVARRLADFDRLTAPVIAFLEPRATGVILVEAGMGNPDEILERIADGLAKVLRAPTTVPRGGNSSVPAIEDVGSLASSAGRD